MPLSKTQSLWESMQITTNLCKFCVYERDTSRKCAKTDEDVICQSVEVNAGGQRCTQK